MYTRDGMSEILKMCYWDNPVLSTICSPVEENEFGTKFIEWCESLKQTMKKRNGLGLAAPQVGLTKRVFAMEFPESSNWDTQIVCNPVLVLEGKAVYEREGCLSLPGLFESVVRAEKITMQFKNIFGVPEELVLTGINARIAQHEFDHLSGIMFFDYKDKRPVYGARMSKQTSKQVQRTWAKNSTKLIEAAETRSL
jgi:peptide deformylase